MNTKLSEFFQKIEKLDTEQFMKIVENHLSDEDIEQFVDHISEYYGIEDDEELGTLAQIMITGYIAALDSAPATKAKGASESDDPNFH